MPKKMHVKEKRKVFARLDQKERAHTKSKSSIPAMKQFEDHPFYKNLMKYAIVPLWEENKKAKKENRGIVENLDKELMYHFCVFEYAGSLYEGLKRLHDIPLFTMKGFSLRWMGNMKIMPQDWAVYNYANYRVVATGIFDTALWVANDVLVIQKNPERISKGILKKPEIIENNLLPSLQKLDQVIDKYRQERHKYVHRSTRPELDFVDNLNAYQLLKEAKEKGLYKGEIPSQTKAQNYYMEERDKKIIEMQKGIDEIFSAVIEFLDALNPLYERKIEEYKSRRLL